MDVLLPAVGDDAFARCMARQQGDPHTAVTGCEYGTESESDRAWLATRQLAQEDLPVEPVTG